MVERLHPKECLLIVRVSRYEMAAFLLKKKQSNRIQFLPVQMSVLWFLCYMNVASILATALVMQRLGPRVFDWNKPEGITGILLVTISQCLVPFTIALRLGIVCKRGRQLMILMRQDLGRLSAFLLPHDGHALWNGRAAKARIVQEG